MKKYIGTVLLLIMTLRAHAQNVAATSNCVTNPPDFAKLSYEEASEALEPEARKEICPEYLTNLVSQIRHGNLSNDNKTLAIYLLGTFHPKDTNSIEALVECIDFRASRFDPKTRISRWGEYPAEEALTRIGGPVINPILAHLPTETKQLRRHLMCEVLKRVADEKACQAHLSHVLAAESDATKKANLEAALAELQK
jgi:hypothetical protein